MTTTTASATPVSVNRGRILVATIIAIVIGVVGNLIVFFIASATGAISSTFLIPPMNQAITAVPVIFSTALGIAAGAVVFTIMTYVTKNPVRWFTIIAVIFLVLSLGGPVTIPGASVGLIIALSTMHVIAGAAAIWALTTRTR